MTDREDSIALLMTGVIMGTITMLITACVVVGNAWPALIFGCILGIGCGWALFHIKWEKWG